MAWQPSQVQPIIALTAGKATVAMLPLALLTAHADTQPTPDNAPTQINVGSLDASGLQPYTSYWRVVEVSKDGIATEASRSFDQLQLAVENGRHVWRQRQYDLAPGQPSGSLDATTDQATFAPIEALQRGPNGAYRLLRYGSDRVHLECRGALCPPDARTGEVVRREKPTEVATYDYWGGSYGLLFAVMPLEVGKSFIVPVFHPARGLVRLQVDVEARESIKAANGQPIEAYRLRTPLTGWIYHVSKTPPYWVRLEYSRPDGSRQITERLGADVEPLKQES